MVVVVVEVMEARGMIDATSRGLERAAASDPWVLSSSSDPQALAVVDGVGPFAEHGPHARYASETAVRAVICERLIRFAWEGV